jgi:hypothetical protein
MSRALNGLNDCCRDERCDRLAAEVFGGQGLTSRDVLATATRRKGQESRRDPCWPAAEVSLGEALSDPIVMSLMAADRVDPAALAESFHTLARVLAGRHAE